MSGEDWNPGGGPRHRFPESKLYPGHEQPMPPPHSPKFYLCFLDFETTGLDFTCHEPIEVAALITDDRLNELGRFESLIYPSKHWREWDQPARGMHERSGLLDLCLDGPSRAGVEALLDQFLAGAARAAHADATLHPAGNSVHFDRGFLRAYFPIVEARFHYRHLDVSSLRLAASVFTDAAPLDGEKPHRAMPDVLRSIQELRHWRAALRGL